MPVHWPWVSLVSCCEHSSFFPRGGVPLSAVYYFFLFALQFFLFIPLRRFCPALTSGGGQSKGRVGRLTSRFPLFSSSHASPSFSGIAGGGSEDCPSSCVAFVFYCYCTT